MENLIESLLRNFESGRINRRQLVRSLAVAASAGSVGTQVGLVDARRMACRRAVDGGHNIKSRSANWSYLRTLPAGTTRTRTFNRRGTFRYFCTIHGNVANGVCSGMCGRIVVS